MGHPVTVGGSESTNDWQRRYDESVAREATSADTNATDGAEFAAMEASGCLPGWLGAILLALTAAAVFIRRAVRRSRSESGP